MATYEELSQLQANNEGLRAKVVVAGVIKAETIFGEATPGANRLQWAQDTLESPNSRATQLLAYVLAANNTAAVAAITGATDAAIQTNVDAAVDVIVPSGA